MPEDAGGGGGGSSNRRRRGRGRARHGISRTDTGSSIMSGTESIFDEEAGAEGPPGGNDDATPVRPPPVTINAGATPRAGGGRNVHFAADEDSPVRREPNTRNAGATPRAASTSNTVNAGSTPRHAGGGGGGGGGKPKGFRPGFKRTKSQSHQETWSQAVHDGQSADVRKAKELATLRRVVSEAIAHDHVGVKALWMEADSSGDGNIDSREMQAFATALARKAGHTEDISTAQAFIEIDDDHSGTISFAEFRGWLDQGGAVSEGRQAVSAFAQRARDRAAAAAEKEAGGGGGHHVHFPAADKLPHLHGGPGGLKKQLTDRLLAATKSYDGLVNEQKRLMGELEQVKTQLSRGDALDARARDALRARERELEAKLLALKGTVEARVSAGERWEARGTAFVAKRAQEFGARLHGWWQHHQAAVMLVGTVVYAGVSGEQAVTFAAIVPYFLVEAFGWEEALHFAAVALAAAWCWCCAALYAWVLGQGGDGGALDAGGGALASGAGHVRAYRHRVLARWMARQDFAEHFHTFRVGAQTLTCPQLRGSGLSAFVIRE